MTKSKEPNSTNQDSIAAKETKKKYTFSGSTNSNFSNILGNYVHQSMYLAHYSKEDKEKLLDASLSVMSSIAPQDAVEGMLIGQMLASHNAAMECFRRAMIQEQTIEARGMNLNYASKLTRSYTALLDSLQKYRGKGISEQKVTVQHVHVSEGGQAIVGNVEK